MKKTRSFALVLALLMLASCGAETTETESTATTTAPETEMVETRLDDLPDGLDLNGETVTFLSTNYTGIDHQMMTRDELNGEVLNDAIYNRNEAVKERLNVDMVFEEFAYSWNTRQMLYDTVRSSIMGGDATYDVIISGVYFNSAMIVEKLMADMGQLPHVDFQKPYWFDGFNSTATIDGKTYMAASDASLTYLTSLFCLPFNVEMANDYQLPDLYALVDEGKWTLDAFKEIISTIYVDLNGDGQVNETDQFGLENCSGNYIYAHLTSSEASAITKIDGEYVYTYGDEHIIDLYDRIHAILFETGNSVIMYDEDINRAGKPFMEGRSLFTAMMLYEVSSFRDLDFAYSVLPYPKFDEAQAEYHSCVGNCAAVFMIPVTNAGSEKTGAVLEALSVAAYEMTTNAYYENTLQNKYSSSEDMVRMLQLLRDTEYMNVGDVFASALEGVHDTFKLTVAQQGNSGKWASTAAGMEKKVMGLLDTFLTSISEAE